MGIIMSTKLAGALLIVLGAAIGFFLVWIFRVGSSLHLTISLLLLISGATIGFIIEWFIDENLYRERMPISPSGEPPEVPVVRQPAETQLQPGDQRQEFEALMEKVRGHEVELQSLIQQVSTKEAQFEGLRSQFDRYRKSHPDSLVRIKGIGPVYQRKLREAGIDTFAELATADPSQLRQALGIKPWQRVDIESWVRQAREWDNGASYD
jgi:predicted flap endonuclease-1-like 5' DNA nuclease